MFYSEQQYVHTHGDGLYEITSHIEDAVNRSQIQNAHCNIVILHTSASLIIQENADPSARHDLAQWLKRLVKENDPHFTHTAEGPDDMPSHIKSALTNTAMTLPVIEGSLILGTWQGIYLWEHRRAAHKRKILISIVGE